MTYVMNLDDDFVIDGEREGNNARFINHSCSPNCEVYFLNNKPFIFTSRQIARGEEISFDYHLGTVKDNNISSELKREMFPCYCGATNCRGTMMAE